LGTEHPAGRIDAERYQAHSGIRVQNVQAVQEATSLRIVSVVLPHILRASETVEGTIRLSSLIFLAVCLTWCSASSAADKVRIGYSGATVSNAMLWVTDEGKLFQKNGIDPQILYLQTTLGQTAMIAGEIDMCVYSGSLLSSARLQGADVVMVASFLNQPLYRLVVRPEIRTVADLKGKRLGVTGFGTVTDTMTRLLVGKLGLDPDKDVSYVQVGDVPVLLAAFSSGNKIIDGAIMQPPY